MARWATKIEIADEVFTGCRGEILDAQQFLSNRAGSLDWANDGTAHVQTIVRGTRGIQFGLKMQSALSTKVLNMFANIQTTQTSGTTFRVEIIDGLYNVEVDAVPDYTQDWFTHDGHSEGWVENLVLRFISKS
jgi:hypothetical protein